MNSREQYTPQSISKKEDLACERIDEKLRFFNPGDKKLVFLPSFKIGDDIGGFIYHDHEICVDRDIYEDFELDGRTIYISVDAADKRPFIYWGGKTPYHIMNSKIFLIDLIQKIDEKTHHIEYIDKNKYNIRRSNINILTGPLKKRKPRVVKDEVKVNTYNPVKDVLKLDDVKHVQQEIPFGQGIVIEQKTIEQKIKDKEEITPLDVDLDKKFRWHGTSIKKNGRWTSTCKTKHLGTFDTSLEAAIVYNEYVIKEKLPYCINNIIGHMNIVDTKAESPIKTISSGDLILELAERVKQRKR